MTNHASVRSQQRSIPLNVIDIVLKYGDFRPAGHGKESYYFSKNTWDLLKNELELDKKTLEKCRSVYIVTSNCGAVITVAHKH